MSANKKAQTAELDRVFLALGHPTRREILRRLAHGGVATVTRIAAPFEISLNAVSRHLRVLERAGLVEREVVGREHYCRLNPARLEAAHEWLDYYRAFWSSRLDVLERKLPVRRKSGRQGRG